MIRIARRLVAFLGMCAYFNVMGTDVFFFWGEIEQRQYTRYKYNLLRAIIKEIK